jgi:hypothetical protein
MASEDTITVKLKVDNSQTQSSIDNAEQQVTKLKNSTKEASDGFGIMDTKLGGMWKSFKGGVDLGVKSLGSFKIALAATGIGILLIAVSALVNYFKNTKEGGDKLAVAMKVIGNVIREGPIVVLKALKIPLDIVVGYFKVLFSVITNTIGVITGKVGLTEAIKNVKEEFKENAEKVREDTKALIDNGKQAFERAKQAAVIAKMIDAANDAERESQLAKQRLETQIVELRAAAMEGEVTATEKKKIYNDVLKLEGELYKINSSQAKARLDITNAEIANGDKSEEMLQAQVDAQVKLEATKTSYTQSTIRLNRQITSSEKAEAAAQKKILEDKAKEEADALKEKTDAENKAREEKKKQDEEDAKIAAEALKTAEEERLKAVEETNRKVEEEWQRHYSELQDQLETAYIEKKISDEDYTESKRQLDVMLAEHEGATQAKIGLINAKAAADQRKAQKDNATAALNSVSSSLKQFSELAGKQSKAGKAFAVASALIDTYTSAIAAFRSMASIPVVGPALGVVAAAAAIAMGLKNVATIRKTNTESKMTGGILQGASHANGGMLINAEGGEGIVNKNSMSNPLIAQQVLRLNQQGNAGSGSYGGMSISEQRIAEIAASVVKAVPVNVTEYQITDVQNRVAVREGRFTV